MNHKPSTVLLLIIVISVLSGIATITGIYSDGGPGKYIYETIHGGTVQIYGQGVYKHMTPDVAIQGKAQDVITLLVAIPLMLISIPGYFRKIIKWHFILTGTIAYIFVTYLFYMAMGTYNELFLIYVSLTGVSFFALLKLVFSLISVKDFIHFSTDTPVKITGGFLMFNAVVIGMMWLGVVIPPLLDGSIYPTSLHHYTTLIVQGFDLGLLLPISFISGWYLYQKKMTGIITGVPYIVFLSILMTALSAKIIAMGLHGINIMPAVTIIPLINLISIACAASTLKHMNFKTKNININIS